MAAGWSQLKALTLTSADWYGTWCWQLASSAVRGSLTDLVLVGMHMVVAASVRTASGGGQQVTE